MMKIDLLKDPEVIRKAKHAAYMRKWVAEHPGHSTDRVKAWRERNPEKAKALRQAERDRPWNKERKVKGQRSARWYKLGVTVEQYESMFQQQNGLCAACNGPQVLIYPRLHVDHDHATGKVRGLLCMNCNTALGHVKDDVNRLKALIRYLEKSR